MLCVRMHAYTLTPFPPHIHSFMQLCKRFRVHTQTHTYIQAYSNTHIHTSIRIPTYIRACHRNTGAPAAPGPPGPPAPPPAPGAKIPPPPPPPGWLRKHTHVFCRRICAFVFVRRVRLAQKQAYVV